MNTMLDFPDTSSWQNWLHPRQYPFDGYAVKVSQGSWYENPDFPVKMGELSQRLVFLYHYWEMSDPTAQANKFISLVKSELDGFKVLVLDYEPSATYAQVIKDIPNAEKFISLVEEATGLTVAIYLNNYFSGLNKKFPMPWSQHTRQNNPVWYAGSLNGSYYTHVRPTQPFAIQGWSKTIANQWTDAYTVSTSVNKFDMNVFFGDTSDWLALAHPPITASTNGIDPMITLQNIYDTAKKALDDYMLDDSLIWLKDATGKIIYKGNIRKAITDTLNSSHSNGAVLTDMQHAIDALNTRIDTLEQTLNPSPQTNGGTAPSVQ